MRNTKLVVKMFWQHVGNFVTIFFRWNSSVYFKICWNSSVYFIDLITALILKKIKKKKILRLRFKFALNT